MLHRPRGHDCGRWITSSVRTAPRRTATRRHARLRWRHSLRVGDENNQATARESPFRCGIAGRSCNITDATPKVIAVAKVRANIVIHICSSIAWQAGAQPVSQPPAPGKDPQPMIRTACAYYWRQATHFFAIRKTCHSLAMLAGPWDLAISVCSNCLQIAVLNTPHAPRGEARGGRGLVEMKAAPSVTIRQIEFELEKAEHGMGMPL